MVRLPSDHKARELGSRAILVKHIVKHWADGTREFASQAKIYAEKHDHLHPQQMIDTLLRHRFFSRKLWRTSSIEYS